MNGIRDNSKKVPHRTQPTHKLAETITLMLSSLKPEIITIAFLPLEDKRLEKVIDTNEDFAM